MKKLLILSGKGGTGKTTTAAAFIRFAGAKAVADCDVDAPNLHLVAGRRDTPEKSDFFGSDHARIDPEKCIGCGICAEKCRFDAVKEIADGEDAGKYRIDDFSCEGCGVCAHFCPAGAVSMNPDRAGEMSLYKDDASVFSTARLRMGRGNSGKLVTAVKFGMLQNVPKEAELAVIDGSPGIGCPVIASVSGVDLVLIVTEPSLSGKSDLARILKTAAILRVKTAVAVNKFDACPEKAAEIERFCQDEGIPFVGKIPYDKTASAAINAGKSAADYDCPARDALYQVYLAVCGLLEVKP